MPNKPIFDDWDELTTVDCNTCDNYYSNTCDGVSVGTKRKCNTYVATRKVFIPEQLDRLTKEVKLLKSSVITIVLVMLILMLRVIANV